MNDPRIEKLLDRSGATWELVEDFDLTSVDVNASRSNQVRIVPINAEVVAQYVAAMERGDEFPPIIVAINDDSTWLIGGNHRHTSAVESETSLDAYVVSNPTEVQAKTIAFGDNATHGLPTTQREKLEHAVWLLRNADASFEEAAELVGLSRSMVVREVETQDASRRAVQLKVGADFLKLAPTTRWRIGSIADDSLFVRVGRFAAAVDLGSGEAFSLVTTLNQTPPALQQTKLTDLMANYESIGDRANRGGRRSHIQKLSELLLSLGDIRPELVAADVPEDYRAHWADRLDTARRRLDDIETLIGAK